MYNIKEIAKMAGVSISTVSRVINRTAYVSPQVVTQVQKILDETGYTPSSLAKEMQQNRSNTVGVIIPRIDLATYAAVYDGISHELSNNNYNILLADTHVETKEELNYLEVFSKKRVDGVLYFALGASPEQKEALNRLHIPVVIVDQDGSLWQKPSVRKDSYQGAKDMVSYLIDKGHTRIGCICVEGDDYNTGTLRRLGYEDALREHNLEVDNKCIYAGDFEYQSAHKGVEILMNATDDKPTAIFCITDRLAVGCASWLLTHGYQIPQDISVATVDDTAQLRYGYPSMTTMGLDYEHMGNLAAAMILDCIEGRTLEENQVTLPYILIERDSTRRQ